MFLLTFLEDFLLHCHALRYGRDIDRLLADLNYFLSHFLYVMLLRFIGTTLI